MRLFTVLGALVCAFILSNLQSHAASAFAGFYVGAMRVSVSGPVSIPEYSAGGVAITVDSNGKLTSSGDLTGSVDNSGNVTFNPGNVTGFTTGTISSVGVLTATVVQSANGLTTTWKIDARNTPPGYGAAGSLAGRIFQHNPTQTISGLSHVRFTGTKFVGVGPRGAIGFSDDGVNWTRFGLPTTVDLTGVAFKPGIRGGGTYVAVGESGALFYSTDGNNWTARGSGVFSFTGVAAGNGLFAAMTVQGALLTSPDGNVWTPASQPIGSGLDGYGRIDFVNGKFVVFNAGKISFSSDTVSWTAPVNVGLSVFINAVSTPGKVTFGNGRWVAIGNDGISHSADGTAWTKATGPTERFDSVAFGDGNFTAQANNDKVWASTDGVTWKIVNEAPEFHSIAFGKGRFVAVGADLYTSADGRTWVNAERDTMRTKQPYYNGSGDVRTGPPGFAPVVHAANAGNAGAWWVGENGYMFYYLTTFGNFYGEMPKLTDSTLRAFASHDTAYDGVFAGDGGAMIKVGAASGNNPPTRTLLPAVTSANLVQGINAGDSILFIGSNGTIVHSPRMNQDQWSVVPTGTTEHLRHAAFFSTRFSHPNTPTNIVLVVGDNGTLLTSPDGTSWTKHATATSANLISADLLPALGGVGPRFMVTGDDGTVLVSTNGSTWVKATSQPRPHRVDKVTRRGEFGMQVGLVVAAIHGLTELGWRMFYDNTLGGDMTGLTLGNGRWVGIGTGFSAMSLDGNDWKARLTPGNFSAVAYGEGKFVAVGRGHTTASSVDGLIWTARTNTPTWQPEDFNAVTYGGGRFAAVGRGGLVMISEDGVTWIDKSTLSVNVYTAITYNNGRFVAVGEQGIAVYSLDNGDTWQTSNTFVGNAYGVTYGNGAFFTAGANGYVATSANGANWGRSRVPYRGPINSYPEFRRTTFANGLFYATAEDGEIYTTTNAIDWTQSYTGIRFGFGAIAVGNGRIMLAGREIYSLAIENSGSPSFVMQPHAVSAAVGSTVTLSADVTGTGEVSLQWFKDGQPVTDGGKFSGATTSTLTISGAALAEAGEYQLSAMNEAGVASSVPATVSIQAPPAITTQPATITRIIGQSASFSVTTEGTGPFTYQWRFNGLALTESANISGTQGATLSIGAAAEANAGAYDVVVSNAFGSATSAMAMLTVEGVPTAPILVAQPQPTTVNVGATITLSVTVKGAQPMEFAWYKNDQAMNDPRISGQATSTLTITNAKGSDSGQYQVIVVNSLGFIRSVKVAVAVLGDVGFRHDFKIDNSGSVSEIVQVASNEFVLAGSPFLRDGTFVIQKLGKIDGAGKVIQAFTGTRPSGDITSVAAVAGGKLVVGGPFNRWGTDTTVAYLARVNADGSLDTSFTSPAPPTLPIAAPVVKVIALADGKLLVARAGSSVQSSSVTRLNADGTADGLFAQMILSRATIADMAVQKDGTIWVSGTFGLRRAGANGADVTTIATTPTEKLFVSPNDSVYYVEGKNLRRLTTGGQVDTTFATSVNSSISALAFLPDGRIMIGGNFYQIGTHRRDMIGIIDAATGAVDLSYESPYSGSAASVEVILPLGDGSVLVGGSISTVANQPYVQRVQITRPPATGGGQSFSEWLGGKGFIAGVNDGLQQDADNDGLSNLAEFAMGSNPLAASADEKPRATTFQTAGETHAALEFTRNKNAAGATITVSASNSLSANSDETFTETVEDMGNGRERVTVRSTQPISAISQLFFHVRVSGQLCWADRPNWGDELKGWPIPSYLGIGYSWRTRRMSISRSMNFHSSVARSSATISSKAAASAAA